MEIPDAVTSQLGCGEYRVLVTNRCGSRLTTDLTGAVSELISDQFRVMDDTSEIVITVDLTGEAGEACCEGLAETRTWLNSVVIERNGEVAWGPGPVVNLIYRREQAILTTRDVSAWLDKREIHEDHVFEDTPLHEAVRELLEDALEPDDPCNLLGYLTIATSTQVLTKTVTAGDGKAGDVLRDLARNYLDFTVIGQRIVIADQLTYGPYSQLHDDDFLVDIEVEERGLEAATKWRVNGDGVTGTCGGTAPDTQYLGLLEEVASEDSIFTASEAEASACGRLDASNPSPLYINIPDGAQLSSTAQVPFETLIPGTLVDVMLSDICRPLEARRRLTTVGLRVDGEGVEAVSVTLAPLGTGFTDAGGADSR